MRTRFEADFADIFEVRGLSRDQRGRSLRPLIEKEGVVLRYDGLDGVARRTRLTCSPCPKKVEESEIYLRDDARAERRDLALPRHPMKAGG